MTDAASLFMRFQDGVREDFPWGWIAFLKSGVLDPGATMTLGVCSINPGQANSPHFHPNCDEILYVQSGACEKTVGAQRFAMGPGDCVRIPRGVHHFARNTGDEPFVCVIFVRLCGPPRRVFVKPPQKDWRKRWKLG